MFKTMFVFATMAVCVLSWPNYIQNTGVCRSFKVSHCGLRTGPNYCNDQASVLVALKLKNGDEVDCVNPDSSYLVEIHTNESFSDGIGSKSRMNPIKGLLIKEVLPKGEEGGLQVGDIYLPKNTVSGVCGRYSISHHCQGLNTASCVLGECLNLTYVSPSNLNHNVTFRYTVVLSTDGLQRVHVQDQWRVFPKCPPPTAPPTTPIPSRPPSPKKSRICSHPVKLDSHETNKAEDPGLECPNFSVRDGVEAIEGAAAQCNNNPSCNSNLTHNYTHNNVNYTCHTPEHVRITECKPTCTLNGKKLFCKNRVERSRSRTFKCQAINDISEQDKTYSYTRKVRQTKMCDCYTEDNIDFMCEDRTSDNLATT